MNVWTYWEGPRPEFIDLCLRTLSHSLRSEEFHVLTPETLEDYVPDGVLHPDYKRLLLGSQVGCIRAAILARHGGWWFDADTLGLQSPRRVLEDHEGARALYVTWRSTIKPRRIINGYIYMTPLLAEQWVEEINRKLSDEFESIKWCTLGEGILTPMLTGLRGAVEVPRRLFLPLDVDSDFDDFFREGRAADLIEDSTVCVGMNHSKMMYRHQDLMERPWDREILIHDLLRHGENELLRYEENRP